MLFGKDHPCAKGHADGPQVLLRQTVAKIRTDDEGENTGMVWIPGILCLRCGLVYVSEEWLERLRGMEPYEGWHRYWPDPPPPEPKDGA